MNLVLLASMRRSSLGGIRSFGRLRRPSVPLSLRATRCVFEPQETLRQRVAEQAWTRLAQHQGSSIRRIRAGSPSPTVINASSPVASKSIRSS